MSFATEWYWYPEGVKTVADRFNHFLVDNDLVSTRNSFSFLTAHMQIAIPHVIPVSRLTCIGTGLFD
jgi:hypothetical protein